MQVEDRTTKQMNDQPSGNLPFLKPDDIQYFDKLLVSIIFFLKHFLRPSAWIFVPSEVQSVLMAFLFLGGGGRVHAEPRGAEGEKDYEAAA